MSLTATQIAANVPNSGAQQTATTATCVNNSPVSGQMAVTTVVPVSPGLSPGLTYPVALTGTGGTSLAAATLTATSVTGAGPYTVVGTIAGTCPTGLAGTVNGGTGAAINFPGISTTAPYNSGSTGIATHNNQHICGWIVENGSDSNFPGSQAIEMVDNQGNSLTGSPALVPFLNQGTSSFVGSTTGSSAVVTVSAMTPYTITGAVYSGTTGFVTFPVSTNPGFVPGTEFTVSGVAPSGFNATYIAVAGTSSTQVVGEPLSAPVGIPQPFGSSPGTYSSGGSLVSIIIPGQTVSALSIYAVIMPYGTNGTSGAGGAGTYALSGIPAAVGSGPLFAYSSFYYGETTAGVPVARTAGSIGDFIPNFGSQWGGSLGNVAMLWGKIPTQTGGAPSVSDLASICTKTTDIQAYAAAKGLTVNSLYRMNDLGIWGDSGDATITGYITNTGANATLNVVSTAFGSLGVTPSQPTASLTGPGLPVASPVTIPLTATAGSSYAITPNTTAAAGSSGSPITFAVGAFKPAVPGASSTMKGYIDTTAGVSTLHVTSFDNGTTHTGYASFTGSYTAGVLTATAGGVGSLPASGVVISDGGVNITGNPLLLTGFISCPSFCTYNIGPNYYPTIASESMWATSSTVIPGEYILNAAITTPAKVLGNSWSACSISGAYNGLLGCYTLSANLGAIGSSGSPVIFTGTTITDGGAIAPGPALTINDKGPGIVFPVSFGTNTGTLALSGTYNVAALGGTPSGIQALISNSANGPPLAGCTPCNWGALTGTVSGGIWSGTLASVPGGGPYFVSVRASNGTAYQVPSQSIRVGAIYDAWGNGQVQSMFGQQGGVDTSWFSGLYGTAATGSAIDTYMTGPPISADFVPSQSINYAGDRFGVGANGAPYPEPGLAFEQGITNGFGVPGSLFYAARDGVGMGVYTLGNVKQTQTVGVGDGSSTVWCSASKFCTDPTGGVQSPAVFNAASLTGVWFAGSASGTTLGVTTRYGGALEPGMVLGATGSPTVVRCLTGCTTPLSIDGSTWLLSASTTATGTLASPLRADPPIGLIPFGGTTTPWPNLNIQSNGSTVFAFAGFGMPLIKAGSFSISVNGTVVCQDNTVFAYNLTGGNCTGSGVTGFVNLITGDYQVTFTTAPASSAAIIASWTNIDSPEATSTGDTRPQNLDSMGDGTTQSGFVSSRFSKFPGGINGQVWSSQGTDNNYMVNANSPFNTGYSYGSPGYSQMISWLFDTKFPALIPGASASTPFLTTPIFRIERPATMATDLNNLTSVWAQDATTSSTFPGTVSSSVLLLSGPAVGPMWEGEVIGCAGCPPGIYITSLASGVWGATGSSYNLANASGVSISSATTMQNAVFYSGPGPAQYLGALNDTQSFDGTHPGAGFTGGRRALSRWAAMIYESNAGGSDPHVDRVKADTSDCDAAALAAPCFAGALGTYTTTHAATWSPTGNTVTITGGLAAHQRPYVAGMNTFCSGCATGLIITSVSAPPTQSAIAGQGQVGNTFSFTVQNTLGQPLGGSGSGSFSAGCAGTSGTGSNCIDIAISINVSGLSSPALDTCGTNTINGSATGGAHTIPTGKCQGGQIGDLVRAFRIGTAQQASGNGVASGAAGSVLDDGMDPATGEWTQSSAYTCNIVAGGAKSVIQCIKGPLYTAGVFAGVGEWLSGSTYISYGDEVIISSRYSTLLGYVGGQSFPFTAGSGYTNGTTHPTVTCSGGGTLPIFDVTVAGGAIVNVVPSALSGAAGFKLVPTCSVALPSGGSGGAIPTITLAPSEGVGGVGDSETDNNTVGTFIYDNSCSGPLAKFFSNGMGGCFEPGLSMRPFGRFQGALVSGDMSFLIFFLPVLRLRRRPANDNRAHEKLAA